MNRSFHFIPADNESYISMLSELKADAFIFDLEDAVPAKNKKTARTNLAHFFSQYQRDKPFYIRINEAFSDDFYEDLKLLSSLPKKIGVVLPKTTGSKELELVQKKIVHPVNIIPLIEDFNSLINIEDIVKNPSVHFIGLGVEDMLTEIPYSNESLSPLIEQIKFTLVKNALANNVLPIDIISTEFKNLNDFEKECFKSRAMGFTAKFSIHPKQINYINTIFPPNQEEVSWAQKILNHEQNENEGYKKHEDGVLTTPPKIKKAKNIKNYE